MANMRAMWKFPLEIGVESEIEMPPGSQVRYVGVQGETPCMWVEVNLDRTEEPAECRLFSVFGTGHEIASDSLKYHGTFMLLDELFVGHLFERVA